MDNDQNTKQALVEALDLLVKLHHDWSRGTAYVTVAFEQRNNAAIAKARAALAAAKD